MQLAVRHLNFAAITKHNHILYNIAQRSDTDDRYSTSLSNSLPLLRKK
jgi:hypothetical protein